MAILTERQDKAIAINLDSRKVLTFNRSGAYPLKINNDILVMEYARDAGSKANVIHKSRRYGDMKVHCTLGRCTSNREIDFRKGSGDYFYLGSTGACLKADDHYTDYIEFAGYANAPIIEEGDRCAILEYNPETGRTEVHTVIARDVNGEYSTNAYFEEESLEETMKTIKKIKKGY